MSRYVCRSSEVLHETDKTLHRKDISYRIADAQQEQQDIGGQRVAHVTPKAGSRHAKQRVQHPIKRRQQRSQHEAIEWSATPRLPALPAKSLTEKVPCERGVAPTERARHCCTGRYLIWNHAARWKPQSKAASRCKMSSNEGRESQEDIANPRQRCPHHPH